MGSGMKKAQIYSMIGTMGKMPAADDPDALAFRKTTSLVRLAADCHSRCSLWATTGGKGMILNSAKNTTHSRRPGLSRMGGASFYCRWPSPRAMAKVRAVSTRILGKTMRDAARNKGRWKRRHTPTQDPSTDLHSASQVRFGTSGNFNGYGLCSNQNLGAATGFRPRKRTSSYFLLKWGA